MAKLEKGVWSLDYINDLSDGSFLWVQPGGEKDDDWRTVPRSLRLWPVRDDDYQIDMERLKAALPEVLDASEEVIPATQKPAVLLNASRMLLREIEVEAPKAGMTPEIAMMINDLVIILQGTAALAPVADVVDPAGAPAPAEPAAPAAPAAPAPAAPAPEEAAKDADPVATAKAERADDGWGEWQRRQEDADHAAKLLDRKPARR